MSDPEDVIQFVAEAAGVSASRINPETEIWEDLQLGGDDLSELLLGFQKKFGVNLENVDFSSYAPSEVEVLLVKLWNYAANKFRFQRIRYPSLKIADLIAAAESKSWLKEDDLR